MEEEADGEAGEEGRWPGESSSGAAFGGAVPSGRRAPRGLLLSPGQRPSSPASPSAFHPPHGPRASLPSASRVGQGGARPVAGLRPRNGDF